MSSSDYVERNVYGRPLQSCGRNPITGFFRTGFCESCEEDIGEHVVCAQMTEEFLIFSKEMGNDLSTPRDGFPGLNPGDTWCLCAARWEEAHRHEVAPPLVLEATHERMLEYMSLEDLEAYSV